MEDLVITNEDVKKLLDKAGKITMTNYQDYSLQSLVSAVEDLIVEVETLNEEIEEINQDIEDNYRRIGRAEEINYNPYDYF